MVQILLDDQAMLSIPDSTGLLPLGLAVAWGYVGVVTKILHSMRYSSCIASAICMHISHSG